MANQATNTKAKEIRDGRFSQVWVSLGTTINTGNYENFRPEAGTVVMLPENPTREEIDKAFADAWEVVSKEIGQALDDLKPAKPVK